MDAPEHVLIAEDDPDVSKILTRTVSSLGLVPLVAEDLPGARKLLKQHPVRLVLLDRTLKDGKDSLGICSELKKDPKTRLIPVIILTGLDEFDERIKSYQAGADLFLNKPANVPELKRYIRAFLTRTPYKDEVGSRLGFGAVQLDLTERTVTVGAKTYKDLPAKQFDLLYLLVSRQGKAASRESLVLKLWNNEVRDKEVDVLVSRLRDNLGEHASIIEPIRGLGYRIADPTSTDSK